MLIFFPDAGLHVLGLVHVLRIQDLCHRHVLHPVYILPSGHHVLHPEVVFLVAAVVVSEVAQPEVVSEAVGLEVVCIAVVAEVVSGAVASAADVAELQAVADTVLVFVVLVPASVVVAEVDNSGYPSFFAFASIDYYANYSSSVEAVG